MARAARAASAVAVSTCLLFAGCANGIRTSHDFDPGVDFSRLESYAWISKDSLIPPKSGEGNVSYISPIDDQRIRRVVDATLAEKGYRVAPSVEAADFVVSYGIGREDKTEVYDTGPYGAYGYRGPYGYGGWYGGSTVRVYRYTEGTLTIEFFDADTKQALWVGWGSKRLSDTDNRAEVIQEAVEKILEPLPTQANAQPAAAAD